MFNLRTNWTFDKDNGSHWTELHRAFRYKSWEESDNNSKLENRLHMDYYYANDNFIIRIICLTCIQIKLSFDLNFFLPSSPFLSLTFLLTSVSVKTIVRHRFCLHLNNKCGKLDVRPIIKKKYMNNYGRKLYDLHRASINLTSFSPAFPLSINRLSASTVRCQ